MDDDPALASLSLTHVHYNPADPISYACAWLALVPQGLCVVYATLAWSTREIEIMLMFAGQLACEAVNFLLKRIIKEERPKRMYGKGYGMPSSHAQFAIFFGVYLSLFLLLRHRPAAVAATTSTFARFLPSPFLQQVLVSVSSLAGACLVSVSRVYLSYHTPRQVLVGCAAGAAFAVAWFAFTGALRRRGLLGWALDTALFRALRVRDLVLGEDLVEAGWREWEYRRAKGKADGSRKDR